MTKEYFEEFWRPKYLYLIIFLNFVGIAMTVVHFADPGDISGTIILLYYGALLSLTSTQIFYEAQSNMKGFVTSSEKIRTFLQVMWYSDVNLRTEKGEQTSTLRDFYEDNVGDDLARYL